MSANGQLSSSELAAISQGRLRRDAARAWNAMNEESKRRYGVTLVPAGPVSSYRTYAQQQYFWDLYRSGRGNLAAQPGTSNHGWGLAVDLQTQKMRWIVDQIGAEYGWAKRWSDAPSEWWHLKWKAGSYAAVNAAQFTILKYGSRGKRVRWVQHRLRDQGYTSVKVQGYFGSNTRRCVKLFQKRKGLKPDGIVGRKTWRALG